MTAKAQGPASIPELYGQRRVRMLRVAAPLLLESLRTGNRINVSVLQGIPEGAMIAGAYSGPGPGSGSREVVVLLVSPDFEPAAGDGTQAAFPALDVIVRSEG